MVQRIIKLINKEFGNINQAAFLLGLFSLFSQVLGLLRDRSLAHFIGPGPTLDIYYTSFRIPDFIFVSVASFFAVTALLPFLYEKLGKNQHGDVNEGSEKARHFFSNVFNIFLLVMVGVSLIAYFIMPLLIKLVAPGFAEEALVLAVKTSRIMLLSPILLGLSNLFGSITQLYKKFFLFSLSPVFYNLGIIFGVLYLYPNFDVSGLAWGVTIGAGLHFLIQLPIAFAHNFMPKISFRINFSEIKKLIIESFPRTLGFSFYNITILVLLALASKMQSGSISIFNLAFNIKTVPTMLIGLSYSIAAFPVLTELYISNNLENFVAQIRIAARQIIFWSLPIVFLFIVLRAQIVRVILGSGNFSWADTRLTAAMLAIFSLAIVAQSLNTLLVRAFYASGRTWRPLAINLFSTVIIIGFSFALLNAYDSFSSFQFFWESIFRIENVADTKILMLGLAYSIGIIANFFWLWSFFKTDFKKYLAKGFISRTFFQSLTASFVIGVVTYFFLGIFGNIFNLNTFLGIFLQGFCAGVIGLISGFFILKWLRSEELAQVVSTMKAKFWKTQVIAPPQEKL